MDSGWARLCTGKVGRRLRKLERTGHVHRCSWLDETRSGAGDRVTGTCRQEQERGNHRAIKGAVRSGSQKAS